MNGQWHYRVVLLVLIGVMMAACQSQPTATPEVDTTPEVEVTPEPLNPADFPAGSVENPLQIVILPVDADAAADEEAAFEETLQASAGVTIDLVLVDNYADAMAALCQSDSGIVAVAWLDGVSMYAAVAQNCGAASLQVQHGTLTADEEAAADDEEVVGEPATTGAAGHIVVSRQLGTTQLNSLRGRTFCRLGNDDFYSWLVPVLVLSSNNIEVTGFFGAIVDYDSRDDLLAAVASGDCAGTGISVAAYDALVEAENEVVDDLRIADTSIEFPYRVMVVPFEVPLSIRIALESAWLELSEDEDQADVVRIFLGQDALLAVEPGDFEAFDTFMAETGLNFAQLGN